jgi:hypothetical protein
VILPQQVQLTADEAWRVNRVRLALRLNKLPAELDDAPLTDIMDVVAVMNADDKLAAMEAAKQRARASRRRRR